LTEGVRYYFAVQAYDSTRTIAYSNEISSVVSTTATAPVASFTANGSTAATLSVTQGQSVTFVDTSTGTVESRAWNLGDDTTATTATVVKSYSTAGSKTVTLAVTGGAVTSTAHKTIDVAAPTAAPVAAFSATPRSGSAPLTVQFTDASSGTISAWSWSFGDGATSTARSPSHTYANAGTYTVSLTVTGTGGSNSATQSGYISVSAPTSGGGVDTAGLVAAYGFEETSGTQVLDASGNVNHGTLTNVTRSTQGKFGGGLSFNGTNSLVTVPDSPSLDLTNALTLSAWVYPTDWATSWKTVIQKERSGGLTYALNANSGAGTPNTTLRIGWYDRELSAGSHLPSNTWTHLAATYDGARQWLYVNGTPVGSRAQTGNLTVSTNALRIGGSTVWAGQYFQGLIDEVRIYNRALSQTEIAAVAEEPVSGTTASAPSPTSPCATPCSLWDNATTPTLAADPDTSAIELGLKFRSDVDGQVTGVRFYKSSQNTGTHVGRLWSGSGQLLAQATFTNESASGWQQVNFASPVPIKANTTYVVSYHTGVGRYALDEGYFDATYSNGPLRSPSTTEAGGNGVYRYGSGGVFPTATYRSSNYWVDVVFKSP
jgi:PKD repeat protein